MFKKSLYILIICLIGAEPLLAQEVPFTTFPSYTENHNKWIVREVNPGSDYDEFITVQNLSDYPIDLKLETLEFTEEKGTVKLRENSKPENIGQWITLEKNEISLLPLEEKEIKVHLSIPEKTSLGKYQAAVMVSHTSKQPGQLNLSTRIGNRIYLDVTNSSLLQTNTTKNWTPPLQTFFIAASMFGLYYGLKPSKLTKSRSQI